MCEAFRSRDSNSASRLRVSIYFSCLPAYENQPWQILYPINDCRSLADIPALFFVSDETSRPKLTCLSIYKRLQIATGPVCRKLYSVDLQASMRTDQQDDGLLGYTPSLRLQVPLFIITTIEDPRVTQQVHQRAKEGNKYHCHNPWPFPLAHHPLSFRQIMQQHYCQHPVQYTEQDKRYNLLWFHGSNSPAFPSNPDYKGEGTRKPYRYGWALAGNLHGGAELQLVKFDDSSLALLRCAIFLKVASWQTTPSKSMYGEAITS